MPTLTPPQPTETSSPTTRCPVIAEGGEKSQTTNNKGRGIWSRIPWHSSDAPAPALQPSSLTSPSTDANANASACPVKNHRISIPSSIEEYANHSQNPAPGQRIPLSTQRVISSIPRGDVLNNATPSSLEDNLPTESLSLPVHQTYDSHNWQYPSEQQFYNAMLRKGYNPPVESIPSVLQIHNAVNERSWLQVCKWEKVLHNNPDPKLVKFIGRPKDLSPKAWINSRIFMTQEPFDRHDWYVEDILGGELRRYVIDFYEGNEKTGDMHASSLISSGVTTPLMMKPPSMYIDVRPALDTPSAAVDRMTMFVREAFPGISSAWDSYKEATFSSTRTNNIQMDRSKGKD